MKLKKVHRAWIVLIGCVLLQGGSIGLLMNCTGVIFSAVVSDLGFTAGSMSLYYTIRTLISAFCLGLTMKFVTKVDLKISLSTNVTFMAISYGMMSLCNSVWHWYISALVCGIAMSANMVILPVVINNWFKKKNGFAMGLTMAASGIFGALFNPILSSLIGSYGWRIAVLILMGVVLAITLPATLFLIKLSPEKMGDKPYGYEVESIIKEEKVAIGWINNFKSPSAIFVILCLSLSAASILCQLSNYLPMFANSIGYTLSVGAMMTSLSMMGNLGGKVLVGVLADKLGIYKAILVGFISVGFAMFAFNNGITALPAMYASAVAYGVIFGISALAPSLICLDVYGSEYQSKLTKFTAINHVIGAGGTVAIGSLYDTYNSFAPVFLLGFVLCCISFIMIVGLLRLRKTFYSHAEKRTLSPNHL